MKTRIIKHTRSTFCFDKWKNKTSSYYTVDYKTWLGWRPVCEILLPFFTKSTLECPNLDSAQKLQEFVENSKQTCFMPRQKRVSDG